MAGGDLTVNFKLDVSWLQLPQAEIPKYQEGKPEKFQHPLFLPYRKNDPEKVYARKELARFTYLDKITSGQEAYKTEGGSRRFDVLGVISKIIAVILPTLSVLMPIGVGYLPAWVPFGIGLPVILILSIVQSQIKSRIEIYKREQQFLPYLEGFLKSPTSKSLQFMSQEDLPVQDERLKSDEILLEGVEEGHSLLKRPALLDNRWDLDAPSYQLQRAASIAGRYDLEVSPYLQQAVAAEYAGMPHKREKWNEVCDLQEDILVAARDGDFEEFSKKIEKRREKAYEASRLSDCPLDYPMVTFRSYIESLVELYQRFYLKLEKLDGLHKEGEALYGEPAKGWENYLKFAQTIKIVLEGFKKFENQLDEPILVPDIQSQLIFYQLNGETECMEEQLQKWIAAHPSKRYQAIQAKLDSYVIQEMPTEEAFKQLAAWIGKYPRDANQKIVRLGLKFPIEFKAWMDKHPQLHFETPRDLLERLDGVRKNFPHPIQEVLTGQQLGVVFLNWVEQHPALLDQTILELGDHFPRELKAWIEKHPEMRFKTARDLFNRSTTAVESLREAQRAFKDLKVEAQAIDTFEKSVMTPLDEAIRGQSEAVEFTQKFKATFTNLPVTPFAKEIVPSTPSSLNSRKIEEIDLNKLLRGIDRQMLFTHRARKFGLRIPLVALFAIEGIVAYYLATPWILWGLCVLVALGEGVSYYVDQKLQEMERKKKAIKLQYILRDRPEIDVVPGTKPHLQTVKEVQRKYGLEGVRPTWARILTEESGSALEMAANLEEATEGARELAKEGSEMAAARLEEALLNLYSQQNALLAIYNKKSPAHQKEMLSLTARIQSMEKVLYPVEDAPEPKNPKKKEKRAQSLREASQKHREKVQAEHQKRHQLEKRLDSLTRRFLYETNQLAILNFKQSHFDEIAQILPPALMEKILTQEDLQVYLDTITHPSEKQRHGHALQTLVALQTDEEVPTLSTLKAKREATQAILTQVEQQSLQGLKIYQQDYKSCYGPLARERQLVEDARDKLAETKIYMQTKRKEFRQVSRQFAKLEQFLTPQFVKKPVLQAEIDLILQSLNEEPLAVDSNINVIHLLWGIKEKLNSLPFNLVSSNDIKFLAFSAEIEQLRKLQPADRLMLAKLLRKLQVLQSEKEYVTKLNVDNNEARATQNLRGIQEELDLLRDRYDELSLKLLASS